MQTRPRDVEPSPRDATPVHRLLAGVAIALLLVVALARPNAAKPDLRSGFPLDGVLPFAPGPAAVTVLLWGAYAVGAAAVVVALWRPVRPSGWGLPVGLGALAVLAAPIGSGDHLNYAAYGRILVGGGDPWTASPADWAGGGDPIASAVEEPWRTEPSVYGPVATALHALAAAVGGEHLRLVVLAWQVLVVAGWLGVRWLLRRLVDPARHGRVDALWTLNPLVLSVGLLGAHVDVVAAALGLAAFVTLGRWGPVGGAVAAGALIGLAAGTKFTYAVVAVAVVLAWTVRPGASMARSSLSCTKRITLLGTGFLLVVGVSHAWAGPHVYDQVMRSRSAVSLATPWRPLLESLRPVLGNGTTRSLITVGAAVLAIVLAVLLLRRTRVLPDGEAQRAAWFTAGLATAYSLAAPYTLPWYDLLAWSVLPVVAAGVMDGVLLARLAIVAAAYVPGRVLGLTPEVEAVTLGFRREVAPWLQLALWVVVLVVLARSGRPASRGSRP